MSTLNINSNFQAVGHSPSNPAQAGKPINFKVVNDNPVNGVEFVLTGT